MSKYVCSILNSRIIDELIKPIQARGLFGPRHIRKKPLELPIPKYDPKNPIYKELSEIGKKATEIISLQVPKMMDKYRGKVSFTQFEEKLAHISIMTNS